MERWIITYMESDPWGEHEHTCVFTGTADEFMDFIDKLQDMGCYGISWRSAE